MTGRSGKPSIIVDSDMQIFVGNEVSDSLELTGTELFGFNTGNFDQKVVDGGRRQPAGLAWRLKDDVDLVMFQKELMPVCKFLHRCATTMGLGDVTLADHEISPMLHAAGAVPWM